MESDGMLPVWSLMGNENWCMSGYHAVSVLADAIAKGNYPPADEALAAMVSTSTVPYYEGLEAYIKLGYVPLEQSATAASTTLEYAYDDWTIYQTALKAGNEEVARTYRERALNYRNCTADPRGRLHRRQFLELLLPRTPRRGGPHPADGWRKGVHRQAGQAVHDAQILNKMYRNATDGLGGNDDCGQMSAWYIFSVMGFYPVCPGTDQYVLGAPYLPYLKLKLPNGKTLEIKAPGVSDKKRYVRSLKINGTVYDKMYITHEDLMKGGVFEFSMSSSPNKPKTNLIH